MRSGGSKLRAYGDALFFAIFGGFGFFWCAGAIHAGRFRYGRHAPKVLITRAGDPAEFWAFVAMAFCFGIFGTVAAVRSICRGRRAAREQLTICVACGGARSRGRASCPHCEERAAALAALKEASER